MESSEARRRCCRFPLSARRLADRPLIESRNITEEFEAWNGSRLFPTSSRQFGTGSLQLFIPRRVPLPTDKVTTVPAKSINRAS